MQKLFTYGTLQNPLIQKAVIGRTIQSIPDTLDGFILSSILLGKKTYPIINPGSGSVEGLVLEVTPDELQRIDRYETNAYRRIQVTLKSGTSAWVYTK